MPYRLHHEGGNRLVLPGHNPVGQATRAYSKSGRRSRGYPTTS